MTRLHIDPVHRQWVEALLESARYRDLHELLVQLEPRPGETGDLVEDVEALLMCVGFVRIGALVGEDDVDRRVNLLVSWLLPMASLRAAQPIAQSELLSVVALLASSPQPVAVADIYRRVEITAAVLSVVIARDDDALAGLDQFDAGKVWSRSMDKIGRLLRE